MNPLRVIASLTSALKQTALAVHLGAAALLGLAPSAHAQLPITSGLVLRMDASQITGTATGSQLGNWADSSGLGNNAERQVGSSTGYPMYMTGALNGQPVVRFNSGGGNTGDYFQFTRITTIRTVFWVLKENAGLSDGHFLLGDSNNSSFQFHRASANGPLWDSANADAFIRNGTTKLMGNAINGTTTALPSGSFQLVSLVTAGNVQANNICQDRIYHGSWQGDIAEILIYNRALRGDEELQVGTYLAAKYGLTTAYPATSPPALPTGVAATPVYSGAVSVNWPAVFGATSYSVSYKPTVGGTEQVVTGVSASPYIVSGLTNGTSYDFKVAATNTVGTSAYSSVVIATPAASSEKDILTFVFPGQLNATISGANISVILPVGGAVTALAPTYTVSAFATGSPASGTARDFTSTQTYTVTAEDFSSKVYTVTVKTDSRPPVTNGLVVWLAADRVNPADTNQVRLSGTDTFVKQWNDGSGNSKNATQAVTGDQPKYIASGVGGKPVLRFTQVNDDAGSQLELGDISASFPTAGSMFAVSTITSDGRYNLFDNRNNDSRWVANTWNESVPSVFRDNRQGMTFAAWPQTGSHVFAMESGNGVYRFLNDGAVIGSNAGGNFHSGSGQSWIIGDRPGNSQQLNGDIPEFLLYNRILTSTEANAVGAYLAAKYAVTTTYPALPAPTVPSGLTVTPVNATSMSLSWTATNAESYNVSVRNTLTSVVQVFPVPTSSYLVTGLTGGTPYEFSVQSINSVGTSAYFSPPVTGTPVISSAKNILTFLFPGKPDVIISGTNISVTLPLGTDVTALAPTYTISALAISSPASGIARNFTNPLTYTVTAEDLSTQDYTVTVTLGAVATDFTWTTGTGGNWSDSSKWTNDLSNGLRPATVGQSYYTFNFNQAVTTTNDLSADYIVNKLNFGNTVTIAATNSIRLAANGATLPQVNQNSVNQVTLSSPLNLAADTTLGGSGTGAVVIGGVISGAGKLTKTNGGTLSTLGNNTYTGGTLISAGTVYCGLQNPSPLGGAGSVDVTIQSGGTLQMDRNQITGSLTLNGGKVATGNGWSDDAWNGPIALSGNSMIDVGNTDGSLALNGVVSGTGTLTKLGGSLRPIRLTGANIFTGALNVQAGAVQATSLNRITGGTANSNLGAPTTIANGTISLGAGGTGGTLAYDGPGETTDRVIKLAGTTGSATILQSGTSAGFPTSRGESGLLKFTSDVSSPGTAGVDNRKILILTQSNSAATGTNPGRGEISGSIGDSVLGTIGQLATSVTKSGFCSWTLSGENTYSGVTKVQAGALAFSRSNSLGSGSLDITTGAKVQLDFIGTRQISSLTFDAGAAKPNGSYGSSSSLATFKDDSRFSGLGTVTVGTIAGATTTTLARTTGSEPSNGGEALTFTATVAGGSPTGNVAFYDGLTLIGTSALNGSFQATVATSSLTAAVHVISALYVGSPGNAPSSGNLTQTVVESRTLATTTSLAVTSGSNPSAYGAAVTFTATVAGSSPAGSVVFYNGASPLGTVTLNGAGLASLITNNLPVGWRPITVRYLGDATHLPSATAAASFQTVNPPTGNGKLKVFILSGQSNMVGKGQVEFGRDPNNSATTNLVGGLGSLRNMLNRNPNKYSYLADPANPTAQGNPGFMKRSDVWVNYFGEPAVPRKGILDTDFGNTGGQGLIGPEYGFGLVAGSQLGDQVLLIKVAWGGKSLLVDFRPPGAVTKRGGVVGPYYTQMIDRVHYVLNNLATEYPAYTGSGYEIVGFGWHQGWNDQGQATSVYEDNLVDLIKDIRTEFAVPNLPVSIGITGMANSACQTILQAQLNVGNPALHPEFAGTVASVDTRPFDYGVLLGTSIEGVHWNWNGESYFNIGESMGIAMMSMVASPAKHILTFDFPGLSAATITGTNISVTVPSGTNVTALAPTYTLSALASASPASGTARNFTTPQTYTVTAQDLTTQVYTVTVTFAASPYSTWASNPAQGLTVGVNDAALADPDGDGLSNLLEFTLGGAPLVSSQVILPALTKAVGSWLFEYERSDAAQPTTVQVVEYGSDLTGWTPVTIPTTSAGIVTITPGSPSDHVTVAIPAGGNQKFVRLKVSQ